MVELVENARPVRELARDLTMSELTIYTWRRPARIDRGEEAGLTSRERAELSAMRQPIRELEAEVAVHRRATELLKKTSTKGGGVDPLSWTPSRFREKEFTCDRDSAARTRLSSGISSWSSFAPAAGPRT